MLDKDINVLLSKAEELKALFVLGQRVVPFLEEIFIFIREISPILDGVNTAIEENMRKMPRASEQLSKVTEATELATTEIMDILDGFKYKCDVISGNLQDLNKTDSDENKQLVGNSETLLDSLRSDAGQIMLALQVQDITSQQLAAVKHLLMTVQSRLGSILNHFDAAKFSSVFKESADDKTAQEQPSGEDNVTAMHRTIAFDAEAIHAIQQKSSRQSDVEGILQAYQQAGGNIDALRAAGLNLDGLTAAKKSDDGPASDRTDTKTAAARGSAYPGGDEAATQDSIDAIFEQNDDARNADEENPKVNQDDIDAMFGDA